MTLLGSNKGSTELKKTFVMRYFILQFCGHFSFAWANQDFLLLKSVFVEKKDRVSPLYKFPYKNA